MNSPNVVELADRISRRRSIGTAACAIIFLAIQIIVRPVFRADGYGASGWRYYAWPLNAALLLLLLLPAGGVIWGARVRALVNDEIALDHARAAASVGFWIAMLIALAVYVMPGGRVLSAREAIYLIVTPTAGIALLFFAWREARSLRDG